MESPDDAEALHLASLIRRRTGDLNQAKADLVRALDKNRADGRLLLSLGDLELEQRSWGDAAKALRSAAGVRPSDLRAARRAPRALFLVDDWAAHVVAFERAVRLIEKPSAPPVGAALLAPAPKPPSATLEHLALAVLYADRIGDVAKAKAHASAFEQGGGADAGMEGWIRELLAK
jgi:tetratricopeptide (TPR) repeat protein